MSEELKAAVDCVEAAIAAGIAAPAVVMLSVRAWEAMGGPCKLADIPVAVRPGLPHLTCICKLRN